MPGKITYTPFIPKFEIPESQAIAPIPISFPKNNPKGAIPGEQLVVKYNLNPEREQVQNEETPITWSKLQLHSNKPTIAGTYNDKNKFVSDLSQAYEKELESRGLSKDYAKYIVAQDALESNWGKSSLARYFNFGGVKEIRDDQEGIEANTKESFDGKTLKTVKQKFRKFKDLEDYVKYKIDLLGNDNYNVFSYRPDQLYSRLVSAPKKYATDPDYLNKMNQMYKSVLATIS